MFYLVQRLSTVSTPIQSAVGIDRLVDHDYMGSPEFEFGAVPAAWKVLRDAVSRGSYLSLIHPSLRLRFSCTVGGAHILQTARLRLLVPSSVVDGHLLQRGVEDLFTGRLRTKEPLRACLEGNTDFHTHWLSTSAWLALPDTSSGSLNVPVFMTPDVGLMDAVVYELRNCVPTNADMNVELNPVVDTPQPESRQPKYTLEDFRLFDTVLLDNGIGCVVRGINDSGLKLMDPSGSVRWVSDLSCVVGIGRSEARAPQLTRTSTMTPTPSKPRVKEPRVKAQRQADFRTRV